MADAIAPTDGGMALTAWYEARGISRATAFKLVGIAGLDLAKVRLPGTRPLVAWLEPGDVEALDILAAQHRGGFSLTRLEAIHGGALATRQQQDAAGPGDQPGDPEALARGLALRLEAGERAIRSGLPLTTAEVAWLIGARPGGDVVQRGQVVAVRHGRNVWTLEPAEAEPEPS